MNPDTLMNPDTTSVKQAAKLLGRSLCGQVPHVVGVSPRRSNPAVPKLELYVYIDSLEAEAKVPSYFQGHKVHVELVGTPKFLST